MKVRPFLKNFARLAKNCDCQSYYDTIGSKSLTETHVRIHASALHFALALVCKVNVKTRLFTFVTSYFVSVSFSYIIKSFQHISIQVLQIEQINVENKWMCFFDIYTV